MEKVYKKFCTKVYMRTSGFIPSLQPGMHLYPGDYFKIQNGGILLLGNIYKDDVITGDRISIDHNIKQSAAIWDFNEGVSKLFSGRETRMGDADLEYNKHVLSFASAGSFAFKGNDPVASRIANWNVVHPDLTIKMTQTLFSFRELYVVTECVVFSEWSLAIAGGENAELALINEASHTARPDIFGHINSKMLHSRDLEYFNQVNKPIPSFFKAKKLVVQDERRDYIISQLIQRRLGYNEWGNKFFDGNFHFDGSVIDHTSGHSDVSILDMLQVTQLNPNTALQYFTWGDANLDDIEKLFVSYEN